ncbi:MULTISPECIES: hypothetical protein [unclassified Gilliamella]|uniref:hypothetical protein n=1 Tax=unclassified Gilliamella TaxID=2685620 RepID=UPI00226A4878|nr:MULTISPECIES: hypothetical protein [unclassified Gilliamella]MCX8587971.1 hypothetical protein [Gilliamella sp. B3801]MCX8592410.1 hypothetical protein [Gilliamella sp. B3804]
MIQKIIKHGKKMKIIIISLLFLTLVVGCVKRKNTVPLENNQLQAVNSDIITYQLIENIKAK